MSRKSGGSTPGGRICNRTVCGKSQGNSEKCQKRREKRQGSSEKWLERSEKCQKRRGKRLGTAG